MPKRATDYRIRLPEDLKDPVEAAAYINAAIQDSEEMFLVALRNVAEAHQIAKVAKGAGLGRESIYRMLCTTGNPEYSSLSGILRALRLRIVVEPERTPRRRPARAPKRPDLR